MIVPSFIFMLYCDSSFYTGRRRDNCTKRVQTLSSPEGLFLPEGVVGDHFHWVSDLWGGSGGTVDNEETISKEHWLPVGAGLKIVALSFLCQIACLGLGFSFSTCTSTFLLPVLPLERFRGAGEPYRC